jgi:hypothetical protein
MAMAAILKKNSTPTPQKKAAAHYDEYSYEV